MNVNHEGDKESLPLSEEIRRENLIFWVILVKSLANPLQIKMVYVYHMKIHDGGKMGKQREIEKMGLWDRKICEISMVYKMRTLRYF